jgi:hypothetical protein
MARVFVSYKRDLEPDASLSAALLKALSESHEVFIDRTMPVGTNWAREIDARVRSADYLVLLLSEQAAQSEMVKAEVDIARDRQSETSGRPVILPVRVRFNGALPYPLRAWLDPLQYTMWSGDEDTARVVMDILRVVSGRSGELPLTGGGEESVQRGPLPSAPLPPPGGPLEIDDPWYIPHAKLEEAIAVIRRPGGCTVSIKGARQMGKSSLLLRLAAAALDSGRRAVVLDFQMLGSAGIHAGPAEFLRWFSTSVAEQLGSEAPSDADWSGPLSPAQKCSLYFERRILKDIGVGLTLAMDEVDVLFAAPFRDDFFAMLRSWHSARALPTKRLWKKVDILLATSTEPFLFIASAHQSPFNVGLVVEMADWTLEQVGECNRMHGSPLSDSNVTRLHELLSGHPYLTRRALYALTGERPPMAAESLFVRASEDGGPFGDHLRNHLLRLSERPELADGFRAILDGTGIEERLFERFRGAGLAKRQAGCIVPRCKLYEAYFRERLRA